MSIWNKASFIGRLTRDPDLRKTSEDTSVCNFSIAVRKAVKPKEGEPDANFIDCVAWRQRADYLCNYGSKGRLVAVDGEMVPRSYTDKDGINRKTVELVVDNLSFLDSRSDGNSAPANESAQPGDGDLPF